MLLVKYVAKNSLYAVKVNVDGDGKTIMNTDCVLSDAEISPKIFKPHHNSRDKYGMLLTRVFHQALNQSSISKLKQCR